MKTTAVEYDCPDCGAHVCSFGIGAAPSPPYCATCLHLREWVPAGPEREAMRAHIYDSEAMAFWEAQQKAT